MDKILYNIHDIGGDIVKDNETYCLRDNSTLHSMVLSSTYLYRGQQTRGHRHPGQEEIYFFVRGHGEMIVGEETSQPIKVMPGSVVLIPDGAFHKVINTGDAHMLFNCVFGGKRDH